MHASLSQFTFLLSHWITQPVAFLTIPLSDRLANLNEENKNHPALLAFNIGHVDLSRKEDLLLERIWHHFHIRQGYLTVTTAAIVRIHIAFMHNLEKWRDMMKVHCVCLLGEWFSDYFAVYQTLLEGSEWNSKRKITMDHGPQRLQTLLLTAAFFSFKNPLASREQESELYLMFCSDLDYHNLLVPGFPLSYCSSP